MTILKGKSFKMALCCSTTDVNTFPDGRDPKGLNGGSALHPVPNWPPKATADLIGQVSGVALDSYSNPVIFHRGDRTWNMGTFGR